jgi:hypothetical protein
VLTTDVVRWGIDTLGGRRIHPAFVFYLYLRKTARQGDIADATASSAELQAWLSMAGGPPDRPYYRPMRERGTQKGVLARTFWTQPNLSGSWSPKSLERIGAARWMVNADHEYVLPSNHAALALERLLFNEPVSALATAAYFLRNDGFVLSGEPDRWDLIAAFQTKFDFDRVDDADFATLFSVGEHEGLGWDWFEPVGGDLGAPTQDTGETA